MRAARACVTYDMTKQHRAETPTAPQLQTMNAMHQAAALHGAMAVCCGVLPSGTYVFEVRQADRPGPYVCVRIAADGSTLSTRHP